MINLSAEVNAALAAGGAVVALETTIVTHGLPYPASLEAAQRAEAAVRAAGAIPASVSLIDGDLRVGTSPAALEALAEQAGRGQARKLAAHDLAPAIARRDSGGTTVSATVFAAARAGIPLFATGGIGGLHRSSRGEARATFALPLIDLSSDLGALARTPVAVVSAGAKSILDLPGTLELLEALGVPVWGYRTAELPAFYVPTSGLPLRERADDAATLARWIHVRFDGLGQPGVLIAQPPPAHPGLDATRVEAAIEAAVEAAATSGISGPAITPFLLARVAGDLGPAAVEVNIALLEANARLAGEIAVALAALRREGGRAR
jgi:pseudouridine-5'-phosphate glycosidase